MLTPGQIAPSAATRRTPVARRSIGDGPAPASDEPYVVEGGARGWPAVGRWTPAYLREILGHHPVRVSGGNTEQYRTQLELSTLGAFVDEHCLGGKPSDPSRIPYLQELDLLQAEPALARDLRFGSLFPQPCKQRYFSWLGVAGSRTGLHTDNLENLHLLVYGSKRYVLLRPDALPRRLITDKYDPGTRCARVDVAELERRFDAGEEAARPTIYEVVLRPGDLLYTPLGWWHEVTSVDTTISVNCFMMFARDMPRILGSITLLLLHHAGLYQRGNCVCHVERASTVER